MSAMRFLGRIQVIAIILLFVACSQGREPVAELPVAQDSTARATVVVTTVVTPEPTPTPTPTPTPIPTPEVALPSVYSGQIVVSGGNVPERAKLVAKIGSYTSPPAIIEGQEYKNLVVDPGEISMEGRAVAFILNGVVAQTEHTYTSGSRHRDFLLVFPPLPTPEPTPTPVPTPTPTVEAALPSAYSGQIVVSGGSVPEAAELVARVGSYTSPPAMIEGQGYRNLVVDPGDISKAGRAIAFVLNGVVAQTTHTYASGSHQQDFLLVFPPLPTPEPTPTPTPTPTPVPTPEVALPSVYSGDLVVSGGVVPEGAELVARVGSYVSPPALVEGQGYRNLVVDPGNVAMVGREVAFLLNGVVAQTTHTYISGTRNSDYLIAFPALPTPEPTSTPTAESTQVPDAELSEMIKRVRPAVVRIATGSGTGTGVLFQTTGRTGYLVTNQHVVGAHGHVTVTVNDETTYQGNVLGTDSVRDLAVVSICCGSFTIVPFGNAATLEVGDAVVSIGYALNLQGTATVTKGIVSAVRYDPALQAQVIQSDAPINFGNSGGPMLSLKGSVLGINTYKFTEDEAEGLGFAVAATTVQERLSTLLAGTPVPVTTLTPTPDTTGDGAHDYGPESGELRHNPDDGFIEEEYADVSIADMMVEATFVNPFSVSSNPWDYGFFLRYDPYDSEAPFVQVVVDSARRWAIKTGASPPYKTVAEGTILESFYTASNGQNHLRVIAIGERGWLFVNDNFLAEFDLSSVIRPGDVAVITGAYTGDEVEGASTAFMDFTVDGLNRSYGPAAGHIEDEPGLIGVHRSEVWSRDLVTEAEFVNPKDTDWYYGFVIRNTDFNRLELIGVTDSEWWFHDTRDIGDDQVHGDEFWLPIRG